MGPENGTRKEAKNMHQLNTYVLSYTCVSHKRGSEPSSSQGEKISLAKSSCTDSPTQKQMRFHRRQPPLPGIETRKKTNK